MPSKYEEKKAKDKAKGEHIRYVKRGKRTLKVNTVEAKTRPGQKYPGGRALRRATARLSARQAAHPDKTGYTKPGSMKA